MGLSIRKLHYFLWFKLPSVMLCGVRVLLLEQEVCKTSVRLNWINKNPFKSIFWAVQGMAAELATGVLIMMKIRERGKTMSMLVINNKASFSKKAVGRITFTCDQGNLINDAINKAIETGEGQTIWLSARGIDEQGEEVSHFNFEWTIKMKSN